MASPPLTLDEETAGRDPIALFRRWLADAEASEPNDPSAMTLASVDSDGMPDARMVLMRGVDERGFAFYTNFESDKGRQLLANPRAALCFHWKTQRRQVRVRGAVEQVSEAEADAYFDSRPRGSRIGAWASQQSRPLASRAVLEARVAEIEARFGDEAVPRPPHWSGFRIVPARIEFWQDGAFRLHDRIVFERDAEGAGWTTRRLYP
ncbi:pyridoxamine 5'-phosphate oxidase [Antarcticirhabdus aurantiaca]|uniref:Pyridoxamine 5'-phosphate oxidase n=1 Tax=Antarcticirhabdus aurantiaca TaxID=2606717 RepID=A0ACD4NKF8_9HYPH|nr:pyridoxamine 5'-phosphate oxidase [Antarcticirhabdus aurantiaca]WAJ27299.1 pyridoxamine 5'-phosphate oxidase [Jeongeuplla avenae]